MLKSQTNSLFIARTRSLLFWSGPFCVVERPVKSRVYGPRRPSAFRLVPTRLSFQCFPPPEKGQEPTIKSQHMRACACHLYSAVEAESMVRRYQFLRIPLFDAIIHRLGNLRTQAKKMQFSTAPSNIIRRDLCLFLMLRIPNRSYCNR